MEAERDESHPDAAARAVELRRFLRSRRARLAPADVGLPAEKHRRAPGLRREDVAELAEISLGWYGQFELGHATNVSARTVETIGRVLRLDDVEMSYLLRLSGMPVSGEPAAVPETVAMSAVELTVRGFTGGPAYVMDRYFTVLAANDIARSVMGVEQGDNMLRSFFLREDRRGLFLDWDELAVRFVRATRLRYPGKAGDPRFESLIAEVSASSEDFTRLWESRDLGTVFGQIIRVRPPGAGTITLTWASFTVPDSAEDLLVMCPAVDDVSRRRIAALMERS